MPKVFVLEPLRCKKLGHSQRPWAGVYCSGQANMLRSSSIRAAGAVERSCRWVAVTARLEKEDPVWAAALAACTRLVCGFIWENGISISFKDRKHAKEIEGQKMSHMQMV